MPTEDSLLLCIYFLMGRIFMMLLLLVGELLQQHNSKVASVQQWTLLAAGWVGVQQNNG